MKKTPATYTGHPLCSENDSWPRMINKVLPTFGVTLPHAPPLTVSLQMPDEQKI